jgi:hypothetical protein
VTYTIKATNLGPFDVTGARVTDTVPSALTGVTWICAATGGASCPASGSGSGDINETVNIPVGGVVTFTVTGTVGGTSGTMSNTATITPPSGVTDPNLGNNSATDTDNLGP